ncbi:hypothetical protein RB195_002601 [Necator americanus]|uniref:Uncharacterized protein n=1 Tax=Necator americanus TaxID=51031 RepID=A0ABR1DK94_NECAM
MNSTMRGRFAYEDILGDQFQLRALKGTTFPHNVMSSSIQLCQSQVRVREMCTTHTNMVRRGGKSCDFGYRTTFSKKEVMQPHVLLT